MDTSDPEIEFNTDGICNHCETADADLHRWRRFPVEQRGEMHTVPLAAGQLADLPLLVSPLEVEPGTVGA